MADAPIQILTDEQLHHRLKTLALLGKIPVFNRTNASLLAIYDIVHALTASVHAAEQEGEARLDPNLMLGLGMIAGTAIRYSTRHREKAGR